MSDPTISLLLDILNRAFDRTSWHGPNLWSALRGVTPAQAVKRIPGRRCIWEQLLHAAYWKQRVLNRLAGTQRFPRAGSNWPELPPKADKKAWAEDLELLRDIQRRLLDAVAGLDASCLDKKTLMMIEGAAAHDVYHAGQIKLLRRWIA